MDVNLPTLSELGNMQFMDPLSRQQAQRQIDMSTQFQNQNLSMGDEDLRTKQLNNMFQQQNDPMKLVQQQLLNSGKETSNASAAIDLKEKESPEAVASRRQKFVTDLSEDKLKQANADAEQMMQSPDPATAQKGQDLYMRSAKEISNRAKHKDEMEKVASQNASAANVANIHAGATLGAARIGADARVASAGMRGGGKLDPQSADAVEAALVKMPNARARYAALNDAAAKFAMTDPDKAAWFTSRAEAVRPQAEAEINNKPQGIDVPAMAGLPAAPRQSIAPGGMAPPVLAAPAASAPPFSEVQKMYPGKSEADLRNAYKKKYGVDAK